MAQAARDQQESHELISYSLENDHGNSLRPSIIRRSKYQCKKILILMTIYAYLSFDEAGHRLVVSKYFEVE
jgi:hypothetical protein